MVVTHVLGEGHEGRNADFAHLAHEVDIELQEVTVDRVNKLGLVIEGIAEFSDIHQCPGEPEESLESGPDDNLAAFLLLGPGTHRFESLTMVGVEPRLDSEIVVHIGNDALNMVLSGFNSGLGGAEPELHVRVKAEILGYGEDIIEFEVGRQAFVMPSLDGLVPPHGPFPARQPVNRLEVHYSAKTLYMIHGEYFRRKLDSSHPFFRVRRRFGFEREWLVSSELGMLGPRFADFKKLTRGDVRFASGLIGFVLALRAPEGRKIGFVLGLIGFVFWFIVHS